MNPETPIATSSQLLRNARDGDDRALQELFERYLPPLRRWARGRLPQWARGVVDTDDLVQESLLGTLRNLQRFEPQHAGSMQHYLRTAVRNRLRDALRRARHRFAHDIAASGLEDPEASPVELAIGRETFRRYQAGLERLRPDDREAVVARIEFGLSYQAIALSLDKPSPDAARMAVKRAIAHLAQSMATAPSENQPPAAL